MEHKEANTENWFCIGFCVVQIIICMVIIRIVNIKLKLMNDPEINKRYNIITKIMYKSIKYLDIYKIVYCVILILQVIYRLYN